MGDVVLFTKHESAFSSRYTYGLIKEVEYGDDMLPRKAKIQYKNDGEQVVREMYRSVRGLVIIHSISDSDFITELGVMAKNIDFKRFLSFGGACKGILIESLCKYNKSSKF